MAIRQVRRRGEGSGAVRQLPSKRWQVRFPSPDGEMVTTKDGKVRTKMLSAPQTFDTKLDAEGWLDRKGWQDDPKLSVQHVDPRLADYANDWLTGREIKPRTRAHYRHLLNTVVLPTLGDRRLSAITPPVVRAWHASMAKDDHPTLRAHAYGLLRTIMGTAVADEIVTTNPCKIRGGGTAPRVIKIRPATLPELETIVATIPERYKMMILLAAWCALRFGEITELRRSDVDLERRVLHVRRGVVRVAGEVIVGTPKSDAGIRDVAIPPHLLGLIQTHLDLHAETDKDGLLFPARNGGHLATGSLAKVYYRAREAAGRPDLRFHDLRHTGAVLAAVSGATLADLMERLGHTTPTAAMRYQHAAADRGQLIAAALSALATAPVVTGADTTST